MALTNLIDSGMVREAINQAFTRFKTYLTSALGGKQDSLTASQLTAVNSGIDSTKVAQIATNATNISNEVTRATNAEALKEDKSNKVTSLSPSSTDAQYPSAKTVYDGLGSKQPKHNINGSAVSNSTDVYAPTSAGTSGQVLVSNGSGAPTWVNQTFGNIKGDGTGSNRCVKVTHNATSGRWVFKVWSDSNGWLQEALVLLENGSVFTCLNTAAWNRGGKYERFRAYSIDKNNFIIVGVVWSYIYVQADSRVDFSVKQTTDEYMSSAICGDNIVDWANQANQAKQATKLTTARTLQTNLGSTTPASFDGSANASIGVTGVLPVANGGTGKSSLELVRVGEAVVADKADRIAVTAESGVGAITDVDVHIVTALPSDASSHPNRIYLVISPQSQVTQVDTQINNI